MEHDDRQDEKVDLVSESSVDRPTEKRRFSGKVLLISAIALLSVILILAAVYLFAINPLVEVKSGERHWCPYCNTSDDSNVRTIQARKSNKDSYQINVVQLPCDSCSQKISTFISRIDSIYQQVDGDFSEWSLVGWTSNPMYASNLAGNYANRVTTGQETLRSIQVPKGCEQLEDALTSYLDSAWSYFMNMNMQILGSMIGETPDFNKMQSNQEEMVNAGTYYIRMREGIVNQLSSNS